MATLETEASTWHVYIVLCADRSLYTGIAKDVIMRVKQHNDGHGAKYTRSRRPVELVYRESVGTHGAALRREHAIKRMPLDRKRALVEQGRPRPLAGGGG